MSDPTPATDRELEPELGVEDRGPADPPTTGLPLGDAWELGETAVRRVNLRDARIVSRYWVLGGVVRMGTPRDATGWEASAFLIDVESGGIVGGVRAGNSTPALALEELAGALDAKTAEVVLKDALSAVKGARDPRLGLT